MASFLGVNLIAEIFRPGFDAGILCLPISPVSWWGSRAVAGAVAILLGWSLVQPLRKPWLYVPAQSLLLFSTLSAVADALGRFCPFLRSEVTDILPPGYLACVVAALLSQVIRIHLDARSPIVRPRGSRQARRGRRKSAFSEIAARLMTVAVVVALFLTAQFILLGRTHWEGEADCAVVMGAGVLPDGSPSQSLADRTRTACELYLEGKVKHLIFSGGHVYRTYTEPKAMARFAREIFWISAEKAILLDEAGHSTYDTVINVRRIMARRGLQSAILVTHDYHISRTWLAFRRAGVTVHPYAARRSCIEWRKETFVTMRECAAWMYYFFRPLWEPIPPLITPHS